MLLRTQGSTVRFLFALVFLVTFWLQGLKYSLVEIKT